nr:uncharacterized mitochondrial protein AtMg00810-like [Tanacetum cinerariifolium]
MESYNNDAQDDAPETSGTYNPTATSKILVAEQMESLTVKSEFPTVSSPVPTACLDTSPETSNGSRLISKEGTIDQTLFIRKHRGDFLLVQVPDIMFAVCACVRHQVTPKECHLHAVKRIFRYLKGHPKLRLWYPKESPFDLVAYSDSDYGGATQDKKLTTGGC